MIQVVPISNRKARILVVGDSFCPSSALRAAFEELAAEHHVTFGDVRPEPDWKPSTPSELRLREAEGSPEQLMAMVDHHDVLVMQGANVTDAVLDASPELRLVACARGGPVNVDVAAASERGIAVVITPGKNADAVAELTVGFMIMLGRRLPEVIRHVEGGGEFAHDNYEGRHWFGHDLRRPHARPDRLRPGRAPGGHTGATVRHARRGLRPVRRPATISAVGAEPVDLDELLAVSDYVSLHARQTPITSGMIGAVQLAAMKRGAFLINTARDTLVDEAAVVAALASGQLAGLAVDLGQPFARHGRHPLLAFPNVIITTHIGGATLRDAAPRRRDGRGGDPALPRWTANAQRRQSGRARTARD